MPRALSNTTWSPMVMRPLVGVSRPAIMRRVVVLPQPEGPSRVTKELSCDDQVQVLHRVELAPALGDVF